MSPDTPLFGRMTLGSNRVSLGRGGFNILMIRASEQLQKHRVGDDTVIQIECSRNRLQDATTFDKAAVIEQQLSSSIITDPNAESPFAGITVARVAEAMSSESYANFSLLCDPDKRIGFSDSIVDEWRTRYRQEFPDCFPHFPKWID